MATLLAQPHSEPLLPPRGQAATSDWEPRLRLWPSSIAHSPSPAGFRSGKGRPRLAPGVGRRVRKRSREPPLVWEL